MLVSPFTVDFHHHVQGGERLVVAPADGFEGGLEVVEARPQERIAGAGVEERSGVVEGFLGLVEVAGDPAGVAEAGPGRATEVGHRPLSPGLGAKTPGREHGQAGDPGHVGRPLVP